MVGVGSANAPDAEIADYAAQHGLVLLSQDLDFSAILAASAGTKPSVVQIRSDNLDPDVIGGQVVGALRQLTAELEAGAIISVDAEHARVRLLPLQPKG